MKFKVYEHDCETFNMCELEVLPKVAMYSWCTKNGDEIHGMPFLTFPHLDYIQIRESGDRITSIKKNNIKEIYKLF